MQVAFIIIVFSGLSILGLYIVRRLVPVARLKQNHEVAGFTFGVIGAFYGPVASKIGNSRLLRLPWNVLSYCAVRCMSLEERPDQVRVVERWFDANQFGEVLHSTSPPGPSKSFEAASSLISARARTDALWTCHSLVILMLTAHCGASCHMPLLSSWRKA